VGAGTVPVALLDDVVAVFEAVVDAAFEAVVARVAVDEAVAAL